MPMKNKESIPSIDIQSFLTGDDKSRLQTGRLVDDICREVGFLKINNHDIDQSIIDDMWKLTTDFFSLPDETKSQFKPSDSNNPRGYFPMQSETLTKSRGVETPPDLKEAFSTGPIKKPSTEDRSDDFFYGDNIWPSSPENFKEIWLKYYQAMEVLSSNIMSLFAVSLNLDKDYFAQFYSHHISALRALNYPSIETERLPNQQRAGAHTDYGSLTILLPDMNVGGLEVKRSDGSWSPIMPEKDTFIINIGDMMARWTNDRWVSTLHRVIGSDNTQAQSKRRQSIAYFQNPNYDANISCLPTCVEIDDKVKYRDIKAGQYLMERFKATID